MTGPVDQRVMMIFSLLEVQKAIALEHVFCRMRSIFCVADALLILTPNIAKRAGDLPTVI